MYSPGHHHHQPFMEYYFWMLQLLLFNWLQQGLLSAKTNSKKVMMYLVNILIKQKLPLRISLASQPVLSFLLTAPLLPATVHHSLPLPSMVYSYWLPKMMPTAPAIRDISQQDEQSASTLLEFVYITAYLMRREIKASTSLLMAYSYWLPQLIPTAPLLQQ